jgi:hypothetical protein
MRSGVVVGIRFVAINRTPTCERVSSAMKEVNMNMCGCAFTFAPIEVDDSVCAGVRRTIAHTTELMSPPVFACA